MSFPFALALFVALELLSMATIFIIMKLDGWM
jgi:hypothetical protein